MDVFPKFIIEDGNLIIGKVTYHKELVTDKGKVKGGGWFKVKDGTMTFHGESHDFGRAKEEDIRECVERGKVFEHPIRMREMVHRFEFYYDDGVEVVHLQKSHKQINSNEQI